MKLKPRKNLIVAIILILVLSSLSVFKFTPLAIAQSAGEIFRAAYENRYTWDKDFPGYSADVTVKTTEKTLTGKIQINPDLSVTVTGIEDSELRELVENTLKMEVIHRRRVDFNQLHGEKQFELEKTDNDGMMVIREVGDEKNSFYRVLDRRIMQVNRDLGDIYVTVDTLNTENTGQGYISSEFQTTFQDDRTKEIISIENVRDIHQPIGDYYALISREIRSSQTGNPSTKEPADVSISFSGIELLSDVNLKLEKFSKILSFL